jgi:hypothetical protein
VKTDPSADPGAETEGRAVAFQGAARPSLRDRHSCEKPSRPEAATTAARSRTVFSYAQPARFQFTVNQDTSRVLPQHRKLQDRDLLPLRRIAALPMNIPDGPVFWSSRTCPAFGIASLLTILL